MPTRSLTLTITLPSYSYLKQALVGLAVGPEHSSALILNCDVPPLSPWRDGDALHLAMTLARHEDEVEIVSPPLPLCPTLASLSPSGDRSWWESGRDVGGMTGRFGADSGWLADVQESLRLMSAVVNRELPTTIAAKQLLPKVSAWREYQNRCTFVDCGEDAGVYPFATQCSVLPQHLWYQCAVLRALVDSLMGYLRFSCLSTGWGRF